MLKHPFGYRHGRFVHVDEVDSGMACECVCPISGEALIAKKCSNKRNHFALASGGTMMPSLESYFHKLAKQLIQESGELTFPASILNFWQGSRIFVAKSKKHRVSSVVDEKQIQDTEYIADNIVSVGGTDIVLEWKFAHACDASKVKALRGLHIPSVEIDISNLNPNMSHQKLVDWILHRAPRVWIYDSRVEKEKLERWGLRRKELKANPYVRYFYTRNGVKGTRQNWVHDCPDHQRIVSSHLCVSCPYCVGTDSHGTQITCSGYSAERIRKKIRVSYGESPLHTRWFDFAKPVPKPNKYQIDIPF